MGAVYNGDTMTIDEKSAVKVQSAEDRAEYLLYATSAYADLVRSFGWLGRRLRPGAYGEARKILIRVTTEACAMAEHGAVCQATRDALNKAYSEAETAL